MKTGGKEDNIIRKTRLSPLLMAFLLALFWSNLQSASSDEYEEYGEYGAKALPVSGITPEEYAQLSNQQVVVRGLDSHHGIRLHDPKGKDVIGGAAGEGDEADNSAEFARFLSHFEEVKPNFLYEGMFLLPVATGEEQAVLAEVEKFLLDFDRFEEIPYFSKYNGNTTRLFESFDFQSETRQADGSKLVVAEQLIKPFEPYTGVSEYRLEGDLFTYVTWNRTPLYYKWMKGVGQEKMYIAMMAKAYPGYIFFYGLIGAKAFDFFGLFHGRLDLAFSGRAEAVFDWFHKEFVLPRLE